MRNILLISVAVLGLASAEAEVGFAQSYDDSGAADSPAPGTITVRLNGRFRAYGGVLSQGDANATLFYNPSTGVANQPVPFTGTGNVSGYGILAAGSSTGAQLSAATPVAPTAGSTLQYNKLANYTLQEYSRLYPGFDGVAANGLKYGASIEIRQDNYSGAGGGTYGSISQQSRQRGELYLRREWGYIGTDQLGTLRVGGTDGPVGLFMVGRFANFNDGGWNGDVNQLPPQNLAPTWPFYDVGNMFTTNKVIYLSPQIYGFDAGVSFEPSTANVGLGSSNGCNGSDAINAFLVAGPSIAGAGCDALASTSTGDYARRRNTFEGAVRYRGTFGPVGLAADVGYIGGARVNDSTPQVAAGNRNQFDGLNLGTGGVAVTYGGFTVGGMLQGGRFNGQWSLTPQSATDSVAWLAGTSYTFGPVVVGAYYFRYDSPGASGPCGQFCGASASNLGFSPLVGQRRERGVSAGGTYSVAPGLALFLSYLWGDRYENGFNLLTSETSTPQSPLRGALHNSVHTQLLTLGTSLTW